MTTRDRRFSTSKGPSENGVYYQLLLNSPCKVLVPNEDCLQNCNLLSMLNSVLPTKGNETTLPHVISDTLTHVTTVTNLMLVLILQELLLV